MMNSQSSSSGGRRLAAAALVASLLVCVGASPARAQQRPLLTQDPESIGAGKVLLDVGLDYGTDVFFPVSGLKGDLFRMPLFGVIVGISSIAEIQVTGGPYQRLAITARQPGPRADIVEAGETTSAVEDIVIGTKVRLFAETETRPGMAIRFATRLPNAKQASGLGLNTIDFYCALLAGKTVGSLRVAANLGLGILPDPVSGQRQNDVLTYGVSVVRAVNEVVDVVGELNGRASLRENPPVGTESRGELRGGARYTRGAARVDAGLVLGLTSRDPGFGFTIGVTYLFHAFDLK